MKSEEIFVKTLKEFEHLLTGMNFIESSITQDGHSRYIYYKRGTTTVEFLFGPPEWHVEILVFTSGGKYAFKDLLRLPSVLEWMKNNKPTAEVEKEKNIKLEILWYINLLEFVLPFIEK